MYLLALALVWIADESPQQPFRARVLADYDTDGDGRLSESERESLRKAGSPFAAKRPRFSREKHDKETIEKFDADGDGQLNGREAGAARAYLYQTWGKLVEQYGAMKEGDVPVVANLRKMRADAAAGRIDEFPKALFSWIDYTINRAGGTGKGERKPDILSRFDINMDGRLSAEELKTARDFLARKSAERSLDSEREPDVKRPDDKPPEPANQKPNQQ